jgi:hypothetical protein
MIEIIVAIAIAGVFGFIAYKAVKSKAAAAVSFQTAHDTLSAAKDKLAAQLASVQTELDKFTKK